MSLSQVSTATTTWSNSRSAFGFLKRYLKLSFQWACGLLMPVLLLGLWYVAALQHWLPEQILPAPSLVWQTTIELWQQGELSYHFGYSAQRIAYSVLIGGSVGLLLGAWLALAKRSRDYVFPSIHLLSQFPIVGWIPLLMIFLGIDEALKVAAIALAVFPAVLVATYKGIAQVPTHLLEVAEVYQFNAQQKLTRVILPAALPQVIGGVRQGIMQAWLALVFVELLASSEGIGFLMVWGRQLMQMDLIFMAIIIIGLIGYALDSGLAKIEQISRFRATRIRG